ncbi:MAG TPA: VWA domain-containing protein [Candidatus Dormibacteraeota bacterium]|nr:VWA domain-containing protein [Candidatus Dormibacteraeota bacterium]
MIFQQPALLLGLLVVAVLAAVYVLAQRRRKQFTLRFTDLALLESVVGKRPGRRRHLPPILFLLGAAGLVVAMAQPILNLEIARNDSSVVLVIDTSGSMDATDVQPTRLDAARAAGHSLIRQLPANARVGLVSFSSSPVLQAPLSDSREGVSSALDNLQAGGATDTGDALQLAVKQLASGAKTQGGGRAPALVVLLTDGVTNRGPDPLQAAAQAKAGGILIDTVGIGTRNSAVQVHGQDIGGVDEAALSAIAGSTGGKYFFAEGSGQLSQIYATLGTEFGYRPFRFDATIPMVILGTLILLVGASLSLWWFRVLP